MEQNNYKYLLDSQTKDGHSRVSSFAESLQGTFVDFFKWMDDNNLTWENLWYADIYAICPELRSKTKHIGSMVYQNGKWIVNPAKANSKRTPFNRIRPLKYVIPGLFAK